MNAYSCISTLNVTVLDCPILEVTSLQSGIQPPSACGAQDGGFSFAQGVAATGGAPPYSFILTDYNGNTLPMEDYGGWEHLGAGYYRLAIIDNNGCRGEVPFTIEGEDVEISYGTSPECEHRSNGTIWLQAYVPAPGITATLSTMSGAPATNSTPAKASCSKAWPPANTQ